MQQILIGCDPELFGHMSGDFVSVHDKLPGTKAKPAKVPGGAVQVDGVAAEFNIDPAGSESEFVERVIGVKSFMERMVRMKHPSVRLIAAPVAKFDPDYFRLLPDDALELGCEPDFNAYTKKANPKPKTNRPMRTGSGHVHIGWTSAVEDAQELESKHFAMCCGLVKDLDETLGRASALWDKDVERRELYGADGAFRPKHYGVEYRVLSNAWLNYEETIRFVYQMTKEVTKRFLDGKSVSAEFAKRSRPNSLRGLFHDFEVLSLPTPTGTLAKDI